MYDLSGKVALITGASGDIGAACSRLLHKCGANLIISGTNKDKLDFLAEDLGERVEIKTCDLSSAQDTEEMMTSIGHLDIVVSNAGITCDTLSIRMSTEDFCKVLDVNLVASFVINREAAKKMMKNRFGRIINITSVVGVMGNPGQANYAASKAGIIGMTKSMAQELATRNVTVNCVAPGFVVSNMTNTLSDEQKKFILDKIPVKAFGKPSDIANAVMFLSSNEASYITGQTLHVNGGMLMV